MLTAVDVELRVFPTCVGVNRTRLKPGVRRDGFPHTRGGEPAGTIDRNNKSKSQGFPKPLGFVRGPTTTPRASDRNPALSHLTGLWDFPLSTTAIPNAHLTKGKTSV